MLPLGVEAHKALGRGKLYIATQAFGMRIWTHTVDSGVRMVQISSGDSVIFLRERTDGDAAFNEFMTKHGIVGRAAEVYVGMWLRDADAPLVVRKK